jgi:hypothetical protein
MMEKETYATVAFEDDCDEEATGLESMEEEKFNVPGGVHSNRATHAQTTSRWRSALVLLITFLAGLALGNVSSRNFAWSALPLVTSSSVSEKCGDAATFPPHPRPAPIPHPAPTQQPLLVPSTAPSYAFEQILAQSLPTESQDAILSEDTPEAQAFTWLQQDPAVSNYTNLEVLQRYALATLYYATGGNNWIDNQGWLDYNVAECAWSMTYSVSIDCRIEKLSLRNYGLSGQLPDALDTMTDLRDMELPDNALTGQLPSTLGSLSQLTDLSLYRNSLTGPIPSEYGLLVNLHSLPLFDNALTGQLPSTLGSLSQLTDLSLYGNLLDGPIPSEYGLLGNLLTLQLDDNQLTGQLPSAFGSMSQLSSLSLSGNLLDGPIPSEFGLLVNLSNLQLYGNKLTGSVPEQLCQLVEDNGLYLVIDCALVACECGCVCA